MLKYINISRLKKWALMWGLILSVLWFWQSFVNYSERDFPEWENKVAFVLDVSKSMNVEDMGNGKSRLSQAKQYIFSQIEANPGYEYSLTIFAGESQRILPFSYDTDIFFTFLGSLSSQNLTKQGTNISLWVWDALKGFSQWSSGNIIVLTDGDEEEIAYTPEMKNILQEKNIELIVVGFWSKEGGYIPTGDSFFPVKLQNGQRVIVSLNEDELRNYAKNLWGAYQDAWTALSFSNIWSPDTQGKGVILQYLLFVVWIVFLLCILWEKKDIWKRS